MALSRQQIDLIRRMFGPDRRGAVAGMRLGESLLPNQQIAVETDPATQEALNRLRDTSFSTSPEMTAALNYQDELARTTGQITPDERRALDTLYGQTSMSPETRQMLDLMNQRATSGLDANTLQRLRESGLQGIDMESQQAGRQLARLAAGRGGSMAGAGNIANASLRARQGLESDVFGQNLGFMNSNMGMYSGALGAENNRMLQAAGQYGNLAETGANNRGNRAISAANYAAGQRGAELGRVQSGNAQAANNYFTGALNNQNAFTARQLSQAELEQQRISALLSMGFGAAGMSASERARRESNQLSREAIRAGRGSGGGGGTANTAVMPTGSTGYEGYDPTKSARMTSFSPNTVALASYYG